MLYTTSLIINLLMLKKIIFTRKSAYYYLFFITFFKVQEMLCVSNVSRNISAHQYRMCQRQVFAHHFQSKPLGHAYVLEISPIEFLPFSLGHPVTDDTLVAHSSFLARAGHAALTPITDHVRIGARSTALVPRVCTSLEREAGRQLSSSRHRSNDYP